jgi:hypothetical protein
MTTTETEEHTLAPADVDFLNDLMSILAARRNSSDSLDAIIEDLLYYLNRVSTPKGGSIRF